MKTTVRTCTVIMILAMSLAVKADQIQPSAILKILGNNPVSIQGSSQVIVVSGSGSSSLGLLYAFEKVKDAWQTQFIPMWAVLGKNGFTDELEKTEGDLSTAAGVFPIAKAAGTENVPETKLEYLRWNESVPGIGVLFPKKQGPGTMDLPAGRERRNPYTFRFCILVRMKGREPSPMDPLMLHLWPGQKNYTAGTIGISEINMLKLLKWLDRDKNPVLVTGTAQSIQSLP